MKFAGVLALAALVALGTAPLSASAASKNSYDWSGYVARGGGFSSVSGAWSVPSVASRGPGPSELASWVGIGGANGATDLIQTGTNVIAADGNVSYAAWYELYPAPSVAIPLTVSAGDAVFASVTALGGDHWFIYIENRSTGRSYHVVVAYHSTESSAEWIVEPPKTADGTMRIPAFSGAAFTRMFARKDGMTITPATSLADKLTLISKRGTRLLSPSALSYLGSFVARTL